MQPKYELTKEFINHYGRILYRIRALRSFYSISAGDLGGFVESEKNLSQLGDCWIYGTAKVFDDARVFGNAGVFGSAEVYGRARVSGRAEVFDNAEVFGNARVYGSAEVYGNAVVFDNAIVCGSAEVFGNAIIRDYDEIASTTDYMTIGGFRYEVTITANRIGVGCKDFTPDQLDEDAERGDFDSNSILRLKNIVEISLDQILEGAL